MSAVTVPYIALIIIFGFLYRSERMFLVVLTLIFLPIWLLMLLIGFKNIEWFCIYDDHIDVRTIYGIKNSVYYDNVSFVEEVGISLTARGTKKHSTYLMTEEKTMEMHLTSILATTKKDII